jgi:oligoribonuclease NrnB/cAMP/cGMP phosphodiesterase (DHH superfamily)
MKVTIFSHGSDLDGIISASIGMIRYPQAKIVFMDYTRESFMKMIKVIDFSNNSSENNLYIISDLGLNDNLINSLRDIFERVRTRENKIIWVDHHPWSANAINELKEIIELVLNSSGNRCAAELMYERFLQGNENAEKLASIAHTMDFFTKDQYLTPISELIKYYLSFNDSHTRLGELSTKISKGILWDLDMDKDYKKYTPLYEKEKEYALTELIRKDVMDLDVVFVKSSPYLQTSLFAQEIFDITGADLAIFYDKNGKISIRRSNEKIACNEIAENLIDGGGHKFAAGGNIKSVLSNTEDLISEVEKAIIKTLVK